METKQWFPSSGNLRDLRVILNFLSWAVSHPLHLLNKKLIANSSELKLPIAANDSHLGYERYHYHLGIIKRFLPKKRN